MAEAVIVAAARTAVGRARKGSLVDVDAWELASVAVQGVLGRAGVPAEEIGDLVLAENMQGGGVIARNVAVRLGLTSVPGMAVNRHCAAGLTAIQLAAATVRADVERVIVAGGTESSSSMPQVLKSIPASAQNYRPWMSPSHPDVPEAPAYDMSITVGENTARIAGVTRAQADAWAARSHQRAVHARDAGWFDAEIVPVTVTGADGTSRAFTRDEHPRPGTTAESLAELKVLHPELPEATVTAGNSSGLNDAAAAVMVVGDHYAAAHGLRPLARIRGWATVGVDVVRTGLAPVEAIPKALERAGLGLADVDVFEINEAFATMAVATTRQLGLDEAIVNPYGSGISLGHPVAATGARMVTSVLGELARRDAHIGVVAMCAGGGMGSALVLERL